MKKTKHLTDDDNDFSHNISDTRVIQINCEVPMSLVIKTLTA